MPNRTTEGLPFVGNRPAVATLCAAIGHGRVPHAYLFTGPPQVGKSTLAIWLAQTLLCEQRPPGEPAPCRACRTCTRISHSAHPDVQTFSLERQAQGSVRATLSRELGIDTVREIVREIDLLPFQSDRKVYIIEDAGTLTEEAANGLLKTLEEPPAYAILILLAVDERTLPETVRSRCTPLRLAAVSTEEIRNLIENLPDVDPQLAARVAQLAVGRPGWAIQAIHDPSLLEQHDANVSALLEALRGGAVARLALAERMAKRWTAGHRAEAYAALFDWLGFWRNVMYAATGNGMLEPPAACQPEVERLSQHGIEVAGRAAGRTVEAISHLDANVNTRMAIESLLLDLP